MAQRLDFTYPLKITAGGPFEGNTVCVADIDGRVELAIDSRGNVETEIYVEGVDGSLHHLDYRAEPDLHSRITTWMLSDSLMLDRLNEAERDEDAPACL